MGTTDRMERLRTHLRQENLAAAFFFDPCNICYLTGYWSILSGVPGTDAVVAVPASSSPWLAVPGLEVTLAEEQCPGLEVRYLRPTDTHAHGNTRPRQTLAQLVSEMLATVPVGASIGIDMSLLRTDKREALAEILRGHDIKDLSGWLAAQRASKDEAELQTIRTSARIVVEAAEAIGRAVRSGVTETALAAEAVRVIWSHGGTVSHLVVASGARAALPHALPIARPVETGEYIVVDIGVLYKNYWAEIARTFIVGTPSAEQKRLMALVSRAQHAARAVLKPGVAASDVDAAARAVLREAGFDDGIYIHSTGHGLGIMGMDAPGLAPATPRRFR